MVESHQESMSHIERQIVIAIVMVAGAVALTMHDWIHRLIAFAAIVLGVPAAFFAILSVVVGMGKLYLWARAALKGTKG